jgi:tetratricopeptide (TPR) repeat protein
MFGFIKRNANLKRIENLTQKRHFVEAGEQVSQLLENDPKNPTYLLFAAVNAYEQGQVDPAKSYLQQALDHDKENPVLHLAMGEVLNAQKDYEGSMAALEKSADLSPDNPRTEYLMGLNCLGLGQEEQASLHFEKVAREDRDFLMARLLTIAESHVLKQK